MIRADRLRRIASQPVRMSYWFILVAFVLIGVLHLTTPLLAVLFAYLALAKLASIKKGGKWLAVGLFIILLAAANYGLGYLVKNTAHALPQIAEKAVPSIIHFARSHNIELPFTDYDSLKDLMLTIVREPATYLGDFARLARGAAKQLTFLAVGCVIAIGLYLNPRLELNRDEHAIRNNWYSVSCDAIAERFRLFYRSFAIVMGAQILISAINTVLTATFIFAVHLPNVALVLGLTFVCGLLPVVGNLISNAIIVGIGFTVSPRMALMALAFLILIHKLEYFLNSKIIGHRIRNPVWLTLLALLVGEKLMGIPGMILAPVVLHYLKVEASSIEVPEGDGLDEPLQALKR
jgi:predicted PurR-regulated permease PerM